MFKLELLKSVFLGSLVIASLSVGALNANTNNANKLNLINHKTMSSTQFYDLLKQTKPNQIATNFGNPDEMITLKSAVGEAAGIVWVYHDAVLDQKILHDARFVLINGEMKYLTLSDSA